MTAERFELHDASDNHVCSIGTHRELYSLIRALRTLDPERTETEFWVICHDREGEPSRLRPREVLSGA